MSIESAQQFLDRILNDDEFKANLEKCGSQDERRDFVSRAGYDFTSAELDQAKDAISDEDMEIIHGGREFREGCDLVDCRKYDQSHSFLL